MADDSIRIKALIELLSTADGGRLAPVWGRLRPDHDFGEPYWFIGEIALPKGRVLAPGDRMEAEVTFISASKLREVLTPGRRWRIQEGRKLVGFGTVLAILD